MSITISVRELGKIFSIILLLLPSFSYAQNDTTEYHIINKSFWRADSLIVRNGYRKNGILAYQQAIRVAQAKLRDLTIPINDRQTILHIWYRWQRGFANVLNFKGNYYSVRAIELLSTIKQSNILKESRKDSLRFYGINARFTTCEGESGYFIPSNALFREWASTLDDKMFLSFLEIQNMENQYYFPPHGGYQHGGFRCEGGINPERLLQFIKLYECFLFNFPNSPFVSDVWPRFGEASGIFISSGLFKDHRSIDESYERVIIVYKNYINHSPTGLLAPRIRYNLVQLMNFKTFLLSKGQHREKLHLLDGLLR